MVFNEQVNINKPASDRDGYFGGLNVTRNTFNINGGTRGQVNTGVTFNSIVGKGNKAFEWMHLTKLDNYAEEGENVAQYVQANKFSKGPLWARCAETCSTEPIEGGQITDEIDVWISGANTGNKGCQDLTVGDGKYIRNGIKSDKAEAFFGQRITASSATPWAKFVFGQIVQDFNGCGMLLDSTATRAMWLRGNYVVGLDMSTANCQSAIRLAPGQRMTFEGTDQISWSWLDGRLRVQNGNVNVLEIDTVTGDIYKKGVRVL